MHVHGQPKWDISDVIPEQTEQEWYQLRQEPTKDRRLWIKHARKIEHNGSNGKRSSGGTS